MSAATRGRKKVIDMAKKKGKLSGKNKAAVDLGRLGGKARAEKLTPQQRSEIARRAVNARWKKREKRSVEGHTGL